eukprot:scaffold1008_cov124-Cylindrotheca_fusiformis.AAC.14
MESEPSVDLKKANKVISLTCTCRQMIETNRLSVRPFSKNDSCDCWIWFSTLREALSTNPH